MHRKQTCTSRRRHALVVAAFYFVAFSSLAIEMKWRPERPDHDDPIQIEIHGCSQGGTLHWGVNAKGHRWEMAIPEHRPDGSYMDGPATRTPMEGPDENGVCRATLGPFNSTNQVVSSVDFAIQWENRNWDNHLGKDFHIPVGPLRITIQPEDPTLNDRIQVTVHHSKPGGFLHWGVNAEPDRWYPPHPAYRPPGSFVYDDEQAVETPLPDPDAASNSVLYLGPFNNGAQIVTSLHMVVRWQQDWDTDFGRNYSFALTEPRGSDTPQVSFVSPREDAVIQGELAVRLDVARAENTTLYLDGKDVVSMDTAPYAWRVPASDLFFGQHRIVARAVRENKVGLAERHFWHVPVFAHEGLQDGVSQGATIHDDGTVTFALHAPGKKFVALVGDFNQWDPQADIMNLAPDGTWWTRRAVNPGVYHYQYVIDGSKYVADPYARDVEWKDESGQETYIPARALTVLQVGHKPYPWHDQDFQRPDPSELLIYEFFIDDLVPGQGFTGVVARLDYIRDLGANAIEPLPWNEFTGGHGWGYNPSFHFAPESAYGTPDDLKAMIDAAHQRGLAVIMDAVFNHMDEQSALFQLYGKDYDASPYFHHFTGENWGFPDVDQRSEAVKRYEADVIRYWLETYHVDGIRYDATRWVEWEGYNSWGASWFGYIGHQVDPTSYHIAEHIPTEPMLMNTTDMDASWHAHFRWRLRDMLEQGELHAEEFSRIMDPRRVGFTNAFQRVAYVESHDEERVVRELVRRGFTFDQALQRAKTALAITMTAPGITMIYSGQEFGEFTRREVGANPLNWPQLELPPFANLHEATSRLGNLRTGHPALRNGDIRMLLLDEEQDVAAYARSAGDQHVVVAANFSREPRTVQLELPAQADWEYVLPHNPAKLSHASTVALDLGPGESIVLRTPVHE